MPWVIRKVMRKALEASIAVFLGIIVEISAGETHSVKKDSPTPETSGNSSAQPILTPSNSTTAEVPVVRPAHTDGESLQTALLAFVALGILLVFFIVFRSYRLRTSRAERRYGVLGDRSAQELTPLPMATEEDEEESGEDEQTLFDASHRSFGGERQPRMVL